MRKIVSIALMLLVLPVTFVFGQFPLTPVQWPTPVGGNNYLSGGVNDTLGFNNITYYPNLADNGAQTWSLIDMNGDGKPDLVVTGYADPTLNNSVLQFGAGSSPYWKVYLNTGNGFSTTATQWSTPAGGFDYEAVGLDYSYGYGYISNGYITPYYGAQAWSLMDMDGDGKPDLVVTGYTDSANNAYPVQYGATGTPYWNVYLNTGTGFAATATQWPTPVGGITGEYHGINQTYGYGTINGNSAYDYQGSQTWYVIDMNDDGKPDLVVTGALDSANSTIYATQFGAFSSPYWMVYLNTGSGFSASAINWPTPVGGGNSEYHGATNTLGYFTYEASFGGAVYGAQNWVLTDMNGDGKPDLTVMSYDDSVNRFGGTEFGVATSPYWMVYLNTGSGFATTATQWATPAGGANFRYSGDSVMLGFDDLGGVYGTNYPGTQLWSVMDINGDGKPDLVVTGYADTSAGGLLQFSPGSSPYWNAYLNTGSGFSTTATVWATPAGGNDYESAGITHNYGFYEANGAAPSSTDYGSQTWNVVDMNGDGKPDLVVTAYADSANQGFNTVYNANTSPYWNVYLNGTTTPNAILQVTALSANCLLFPNPNTGRFTLLFTDAAERTVEVFDITGRAITPPVNMQNQQQFNLGSIAPGIYIAHITQNGEVSSLKFAVD